jgi:uncharacterized protein YqiB (DUF1249 family)
MELYECNYMRLRLLVPDLAAVEDIAVSRVDGGLDLHLRVLERCKYTTTLNLTYYFTDEQGEFPAPDIRVRIYQDAQVAEVLSCGRRRGIRHPEYDRVRRQHSLDEKWQMNRFLYKWLGYCLHHGHGFFPPLPESLLDGLRADGTVVSPVET